MKILIHDKNAKLTGDDRDYASEKFSKLQKYVEDPAVIEAHFEKQRGQITVHVTITHPHEKSPDHYDQVGKSIPEVIDLVKERIENHFRRQRKDRRE